MKFKKVFDLMMGFVAAGLFAMTFTLTVCSGRQLGIPPSFLTWRLFLLLVGSQYLVYALVPTDVSFSAVLLVAAFYLWLRTFRRKPKDYIWVGLAIGCATLFKVTNAVMIPVVGILILSSGRESWNKRVQSLAWFGLGLAPGLAAGWFWNYVRMGNPLRFPYSTTHRFDFNWLPEGIFGTLVSPGKGLLVYTPTLLLLLFALGPGGIFRRFPRIGFFILGGLVLAVVRVGGSLSWSGSGGWGIRYYVPWIPLLMLGIATEWYSRQYSRLWNGVMTALIGGGLLINLSGTLTNYHFRQMLYGFAPWTFDNPAVQAVLALPANLARTAGLAIVEPKVPEASAATQFVSNRLAVWWYGIQTAGVPAGFCWILGVLLLSATVFFGWRLHQSGLLDEQL